MLTAFFEENPSISRKIVEKVYNAAKVGTDVFLVHSPERTKIDTIVMVTVQTMNYLHDGHHRVAL